MKMNVVSSGVEGHAGHAMACPVVGTLKLSGHQSLQQKKERKRGEGRKKKKKKREKRKKKGKKKKRKTSDDKVGKNKKF